MALQRIGLIGLSTECEHAPHNERVRELARMLVRARKFELVAAKHCVDDGLALDIQNAGGVLRRLTLADLVRTVDSFIVDLSSGGLTRFGEFALTAAAGKPVGVLWVYQRERDLIEVVRDRYGLTNIRVLTDPRDALELATADD